MAITLGEVFQAREAWQKLVRCQLKPSTAYKLAKYAKQVSEEDTLIEGRRTEIIQRLGEQTNGGWTISPATDAHVAFIQEFNELLNLETKLVPCDLTLEQVAEEIGAFPKNDWTVADCTMLAPFFS